MPAESIDHADRMFCFADAAKDYLEGTAHDLWDTAIIEHRIQGYEALRDYQIMRTAWELTDDHLYAEITEMWARRALAHFLTANERVDQCWKKHMTTTTRCS